LNAVDEGAEVTLGRRLFRAGGAVARNERSLIVRNSSINCSDLMCCCCCTLYCL